MSLASTDPALVGRDRERAQLAAFLDGLGDGPAALVLEGPAGIGKTALLREARAAAEAAGVRVLACVASASEQHLVHTALTDLLATVDEPRIARLPPRQRRALNAALLRADPHGDGVEPRAVALAVQRLLEDLARERPLLVVVDDLQWLDRASAQVAAFCVGRVTGSVGFLATRRGDDPLGDGGWSPRRVRTCPLAPLDPEALASVVRARAAWPLDDELVARLGAAAGGNPFYALELLRALPADGPPPSSLPLTGSLREAVARRLDGLDEQVEELLLHVALLGRPTVELVVRAVGDDALPRLEAAERRGLLERDHGRLRFVHPLLADGIGDRAGSVGRRAVHRRLAAVVGDVEQRAHHLAAGEVLPDALPALEAAARRVRARGAPAAAARLLETAVALGGDDALRVRAAEHRADAAQPRRAREAAEAAVAALPAGSARARALLLLAEVRYYDDGTAASGPLLDQAAAEAGEDDGLRAAIELLAATVHRRVGEIERAAEAAARALARAERLGNGPLLAQALAASAICDSLLRGGIDDLRVARALALEDPDRRCPIELRPSLNAALLHHWAGRTDAALVLLHGLRDRAIERGEEHDAAMCGSVVAWVACLRGELATADAVSRDCLERMRALDTDVGLGLGLGVRAMIDATLGRTAEARAGASEALDLLGEAGWAAPYPAAALGAAALATGDAATAAAHLAPLALAAVDGGGREPAAEGALFHGDAAEALIAVDRRADAARIVAWLEQCGAALDRPWAIAVGARCRAILLADEERLDEAEAAAQRALQAHQRLPMPVEHARTLLVLGRIRRRRRRRRAAAATLREALAILETVGVPRWAALVREELASLGLQRRGGGQLTPSEERVARLAAAGRTNREVAAALAISPKTVESHLAHAYAKLGIRTRAELGATMAEVVAAEEAIGVDREPGRPA